jgi:hypothetical protein
LGRWKKGRTEGGECGLLPGFFSFFFFLTINPPPLLLQTSFFKLQTYKDI